MDRQRCVLKAIVDAADPVTLLSQYQKLAATTEDIVSTDVPAGVLGDMVDLAFRVKDADIRSVVFDDTVINPAYPDYDQIRGLVRQALAPASAATPSTTAPSTTPPAAASSSAASATPLGATPPPAGNGGSAAEVGDACAYDPVQAAAARAAGQPPTRNR
jgi:hypothetical protein